MTDLGGRTLKRLRASVSYANVMATVAIFTALGGVSYAAVNLPKNSVGPAEIEKNAVRGQEVQNRSLLCKDFKASQDACQDANTTVRSATQTLPLSCTETPGGPGTFILSCQGTPTNVRASCNAGERAATGGGYGEVSVSQTQTSSSGGNVTASRPDPEAGPPTGWVIRVTGNGFATSSTSPVPRPPDPQATAYVVCES